jgi:RNA recognition motif-containing protein
MVKLFVGGFPLDIEEIELAKLFAIYGDISTIKIVRDKKTRVCKGYAFIEMLNRAEAENAAEALDGTLMNGKPLTVNVNEDAAPEPVTEIPIERNAPVYQRVQKPNGEQKKKRPRRAI